MSCSKNSYVAIRKIPTVYLLFLCIITFGIYWYIWLWKLITDVNKIYPQKYIHRFGWFEILICLELTSLYILISGKQGGWLFNIADVVWVIVQLLLALQILKNIENYVKKTFNIFISHSVFGWLLGGCFYINYKINRLQASIQKDLVKQIDKLKTMH